MYVIVSLDVKFKTNLEKIKRIIEYYGLRKIQDTLYVGDLDSNEKNSLTESIDKIIKEYDSILVLPVCQNCYLKKENYGREIKFDNELFRVY